MWKVKWFNRFIGKDKIYCTCHVKRYLGINEGEVIGKQKRWHLLEKDQRAFNGNSL